MAIGTLGLAFLAGCLSVLSPCVLPLLPIVLGTAASEHRLGPLALAVGLAISFTAIGLFVATVGFAMGLDTDVFRTISAVLLIAVGVLLLVPRLQEQFAVAAGPVSQWAGGYLDNFAATGLARLADDPDHHVLTTGLRLGGGLAEEKIERTSVV